MNEYKTKNKKKKIVILLLSMILFLCILVLLKLKGKETFLKLQESSRNALGQNGSSFLFEQLHKDVKYPILVLKDKEITVDYGSAFDLNSNVVHCVDPTYGNLNFTIQGKLDTTVVGKQDFIVLTESPIGNQIRANFSIYVKEAVEKTVTSENASENNNITTNKATSSDTQDDAKQNEKRYLHNINTSTIKNYYSNNKYFDLILHNILNGENTIYFNISQYDSMLDSMTDFMIRYLGIDNDDWIAYIEHTDAENYVMYLDQQSFKLAKETLSIRLQKDEEYKTYIRNTLNGFNLNASDREIVNQINKFVTANFKYQITDEYYMDSFIEKKIGQCYHFARLFTDLCNAVGIKSNIFSGTFNGDSHAWSSVTIDGNIYYFDPTVARKSSTFDKYSWMSRSQMGSYKFNN